MAFITTLIATQPARGKQQVIFSHFDDETGSTFGPFVEFRPKADDISAFFLASRAGLQSSLAASEIADCLSRVRDSGSLAVLKLHYAVLDDVSIAVREAYRLATKTDAVMLGDYLSKLTDAQLKALFAATDGEVTTLKSGKLTPAATSAIAVLTSAGQ